jgi:hypothetical protein
MSNNPIYTIDGERFDSRLGCFVERVTYDVKTMTGRIDIPEGSCTDMGGAIAIISAIDPNVRTIVAGDTCYRRRADGTWIAGELRGQKCQ